nr:ATP-dependent DNA helicase PIF1-like [Tanacetum cinerariifolium]
MTDGKSGINASGVEDSGSPVSVKHTYIDLDDYPDMDDQAKKGKKIGGKVVVFGGDFRQILHVISNGKIGGKNDGHAEVEFPEEMLIPDSNDHVESVDNVNERMMSKLPGMEKRGGLCNGTRLQIVRMRVTNIEAKIISGGKVGTVIAIPRINISPSDKKMPFQLNHR